MLAVHSFSRCWCPIFFLLFACGVLSEKAIAESLTPQSAVYSVSQAKRGERVYETHCRRCHATRFFTGGYLYRWQGQPMLNLVNLIRTQMPKDNPGSLSRKSTYDLGAFILQLNGFTAGDKNITHKSLRKIIVKMPAKLSAQGN